MLLVSCDVVSVRLDLTGIRHSIVCTFEISYEPSFCREPYIGEDPALIEVIEPFASGGTATFPGHYFTFTPLDEPENILIRFTIKDYPENVYIYDPYHVEGDNEQTKKNLQVLNEEEMVLYRKIRKSYLFGLEYKKFTGRSYLANYPRARPPHFIWRADHFNQTHWVTTRETRFLRKPPDDELGRITTEGKARALLDSDPRPLAAYREEGLFNMTLKVISCAPRALEVLNFLSEVEVEHLLELAAKETMSQSLTGMGDEEFELSDTRTSYNSWLERERSPIVDAIYRRAANLMRIDEALLRQRGDGEHPDLEMDSTLAESLQLVHYDPLQEYTAHHDFGFSPASDYHQPQRFATLLLYLNEGMQGGATSFPRWVNAETFDELEIIPKVGKAVLFYSQLPDGNMDDFSQHEAKKVFEGEKWLVNLWVWGPLYATD